MILDTNIIFLLTKAGWNLKKQANRLVNTIAVFLFIFVVNVVAPLQAATVRINPTKIRLLLVQGESSSGEVEVENPSEDSLLVKAYLEDWAYTSLHDGTKEFFPAGITSVSCAKWVNLSLSEFVIPPFGKQKVNYTVNVPKNAAGGYYSVLFFESLLAQPKLKQTAQLGVVVRIGTLFYIEPAGTIKRSGEISKLVLEKKANKGPLSISFDLKNSGNTDITSAATFHIMDKQGMILARGEFSDSYTFAGATAKLNATWSNPLPKGKYDLVLTVDIGKALEEAKLGRGPVLIKEAEIEVGDAGQIIRTGALK